MNNGIEELHRSEVRGKAEEVVKERFRYADLEHPMVKTLFEFAVAYASRDLAEQPEGSHETGLRKQTAWRRVSEKETIPLGPLELLMNEIKLPALPQVLLELIRVINDPKSSATDLAAIIELDTSLSSYLLRLVNSAYYSFPFPIDTITRAVTLVGTREISALAFSSTFLNMFKQTTSEFINIEAFWKHSIACSIIARALAQRCKKRNPDRHFVGGLLHDIGRLAIFSNIPKLAEELLAVGFEQNTPLYEAEQMVMGFDHGRFGGSLLGKWNFPSTLVAAVRYHHFPQMAENYDEPHTVHIADIAANALGIGGISELCVPPLNTRTWDSLGLHPEDLASIISGLEKELDATFQILTGVKDFGSSRKA